MSTIHKVALGALILINSALLATPALAQTSGSGILSVYVLVNNNDQVTHRAPADFTVSTAGTNVTPAISQGSQSGTTVSVGAGAYTVSVTNNSYGFTPSYSQGCNGTMYAGQNVLCTITLTADYQNYSYPTLYPYNQYTYPALSCNSLVKKVGLRQNVSFTAQGGVGGTYNWQVPGRSYPNVGPVLTVSFDSTGVQLVTVTNATQTATCMIEVVQGGYLPPISVNPVYPSFPATYYPAYPHLPNTGVEPITAAQVALALVLLAGAAFVSAPYVRKAYSIVSK